jgi:hypothetical protein
MRKSLRYLRIAFSATCLIACVLMIALWLRSFWWWDDCSLKLSKSEYAQGISAEGRIIIWFEHSQLRQWFELNIDPLAIHRSPSGHERHPWLGFYVSPSGNMYSVRFAHCLLAMVSMAFAVIPWCPTRFSVRGVLMAMTVVAVIIGVTVWADSFY